MCWAGATALFVTAAINLALVYLSQTPEASGHGPGESQFVTGLSWATQGLTLIAVSPLSAGPTKAKGPRGAF